MNLNEDPSGQTATTKSSGNEEENWRKQNAASGNRQKAVIEAFEVATVGVWSGPMNHARNAMTRYAGFNPNLANTEILAFDSRIQ